MKLNRSFQAMYGMATMFGALIFMGCGGGSTPDPMEVFAVTEQTYATADSAANADLAFVTHPKVEALGKSWAGILKFNAGKPALIRLMGEEGQWEILLDSSGTKAAYLRREGEEAGKNGIQRMTIAADSIAYLIVNNEATPSSAFSAKSDALSLASSISKLISGIQADRSDFDPMANAARRERAQFICYGAGDAWTMTVNPGSRQVLLLEKGKEPRKFIYGSPSRNVDGASVYAFNSTAGQLLVTVGTTKCEYKGRMMPYTITIKDGSNSLSGCGLLLQ